MDGDTVQEGTGRARSGNISPFPHFGCSAQRREHGLESDRVQVPALLLLCGAQNPFSSLKVRFMSVHPWFPPGHMAAVTLGDIRGLKEVRKAESQPSLTI